MTTNKAEEHGPFLEVLGPTDRNGVDRVHAVKALYRREVLTACGVLLHHSPRVADAYTVQRPKCRRCFRDANKVDEGSK